MENLVLASKVSVLLLGLLAVRVLRGLIRGRWGLIFRLCKSMLYVVCPVGWVLILVGQDCLFDISSGVEALCICLEPCRLLGWTLV